MSKRNLVFTLTISLLGFCLAGWVSASYKTSGNFTSTNLLSGQPAIVSIDSFVYNLSAKPSGTTATIQFSQNSSTWYNSSGVLGGTNTLTTGTNNTISLSALSWSGTNFYYKVYFTSDGVDTPVLDDVTVNFTLFEVPTVTTQPATNIQPTSATGNGNITNVGSGNCNERGIRWGTIPGTYFASSTYTGSFSAGAFTQNMTGLIPGVTYYYQAMAHNSSGWGYGSEQSFTTSIVPCQEHNVFGYAWSQNIGWISFSCTNESNLGEGVDYGVDIATSTGAFSGYAWSSSIGWISMAPEGTYPASPSYATQLDFDTDEITGWARACAVFQNGCSGTLKPASERGSWDGWLKLGYDSSSSGGEFSGWAWASDVLGWVSFNRLNCDSNNDGISDQGNYSQCPTGTTVSDYKVETTLNFNSPPNKPVKVGEIENGCAWGSTPQVALGSALTFAWTYSDPDSDPQAAYEIEVDTNTSFLATKFNHLVNAAGTNYTLDLDQDDNSDWLSELAWGTTYYWHVRVQDNQSNWSEWSDPYSFQTSAHAYPNPNFDHQPVSPSVGEEVTFVDSSNCYDSGDNPILCKNVSGASYQWDFQDDSSIDSTAKGDATSTFPGTGDYSVRLYVTDEVGTCNTLGDTPIGVEVPLPKYKEAPPIIWMKKVFLAFLNFISPI